MPPAKKTPGRDELDICPRRSKSRPSGTSSIWILDSQRFKVFDEHRFLGSA